MKNRIHTILPIALALLLPGLSIYSNSGSLITEVLGFFASWGITSVILYLLWYLLWYLWEVRRDSRKWLPVLALAVGIGASIGGLFVFLVRENTTLEWPLSARMVLASILFLAIQYALRTQENVSRLQVEKEQIQTEHYRVQLRALRNKIDPHFLFNSLNTLRSMVRQQHPQSEQFIMSLSDFYRQTLKYDENTSLRLSEELAVLQSYLFLMQSRHEAAVRVNIDIDSSLLQYQVPTLALQVVAENCFKHNSMTSKNPLQIDIQGADDYYIEVRNNRQPKLGKQESSGYGLELLRKRYEVMNLPRGILVEETPDQFIVKLQLF